MATKKCTHWQNEVTWTTDGREFSWRCSDCGEQHSLGRSNDRDPSVQIEIRAAALAAGARSRKMERYGMTVHGIDREGIRDEESVYPASYRADVDAGWLCREIRTHEDNDVVAEQTSHDVAASVVRHGEIDRSVAVDATPPTADEIEADNAPGEMPPWTCPAESDECAIRRQCTNKCGRNDRPAGWGRDLDAIEYEHTRRAEPDPRDEDEPAIGEHTPDCDRQTDAALPCNCAETLLAPIRQFTDAELDAAEPPADVVAGIEAIAGATDDEIILAIAHSPLREPDTSGATAVGIYVVMDRDPIDALEMIAECNDLGALTALLEMVTLPGSKDTDRRLNAMFIEPVQRRIAQFSAPPIAVTPDDRFDTGGDS